MAGGNLSRVGGPARRVVVVGAGLAGLRAAWGLARRGIEVVVLERRSTAGGRAGSAPDPRTGEPVDTGQHAFMRCYRETERWLGALGTWKLVRFQDRLDILHVEEGRPAIRLVAGSFPGPLSLFGAVMGLKGVRLADRLAAIRLAGSLRPSAFLDSLTVEAWEDRQGIPGPLRRYLLHPLASAALNEDPSRASALPLARVLGILAWGGGRAAAVGLSSVGLSDLYVEPVRGILEAGGGRLETGAWATKVIGRPGGAGTAGVVGVEMANGEALEADAVVLAVPPWDLAPLLAAEAGFAAVAAKAASFEASPVLTLHLWWDREVAPASMVGLQGSPFDWLFSRTRSVGAGREGGEHVCLVKSGARELLGRKPDDLGPYGAEEVRRLFPATRAARVTGSRVVWETKATISLVPGTDAKRPGPLSGVPGVFLAGDWTDTGLPATIEGAVISGARAERSVAGRLGR